MMESKQDLAGKWALVTGASRGVGQQIAFGLSRQGCNLILHARKKENLERTLSMLSPVSVISVEAELSDAQAVDSMLNTLLETVPQVDIVYNNAAIMTPWCENLSTPPKDFELSFAVNVIALARICDRLIPGMVERGWGRIINTTSGIENQPELMAYSMSKAAVDRYVRDRVSSLEGTGVLMNLLDPGWLQTDLGGDQAPNKVESVLPGALIPALYPNEGPSGTLICAQDHSVM